MALQLQIWPWIEEWLNRHQKSKQDKSISYCDGGVDESDIARYNFLKMLQRLRIVLLQDLAVLQPEHPKLVLFLASVFGTDDWQNWACRVRGGVPENSAIANNSLLLEQAVPEIASTLVAGTQAVTQQAQQYYENLERQIGVIGANLNAFTSGQIPVTLQIGAGQPQQANLATTLSSGHPSAPAPEASSGRFDLSPPLAPAAIGPPRYEFANNNTVPDLWREWTVGICGQPSIQFLESQYGVKWRQDRRKISFYSRRKVIIDAIFTSINRGMTEEEAVVTMERTRGSWTLNKLSNVLVQKRKTG